MMHVTLWGTRGSVAAPGPETARYGGNTSCVEVRGTDGTVLILDAGTGIRRLGAALPRTLRRVDLLLTHLHMDHLQGLGFFAPLYNPAMEVHIWGPRPHGRRGAVLGWGARPPPPRRGAPQQGPPFASFARPSAGRSPGGLVFFPITPQLTNGSSCLGPRKKHQQCNSLSRARQLL